MTVGIGSTLIRGPHLVASCRAACECWMGQAPTVRRVDRRVRRSTPSRQGAGPDVAARLITSTVCGRIGTQHRPQRRAERPSDVGRAQQEHAGHHAACQVAATSRNVTHHAAERGHGIHTYSAGRGWDSLLMLGTLKSNPAGRKNFQSCGHCRRRR